MLLALSGDTVLTVVGSVLVAVITVFGGAIANNLRKGNVHLRGIRKEVAELRLELATVTVLFGEHLQDHDPHQQQKPIIRRQTAVRSEGERQR